MIHCAEGGHRWATLAVRASGKMLRQQNARVENGPRLPIGLGYWLQDVGGYAAAGHAGDSRRVHSSLLTVPGRSSGVCRVQLRGVRACGRPRRPARARARAGGKDRIAAPAAAPAGPRRSEIDPAISSDYPASRRRKLGSSLLLASWRRCGPRLQGNDLKLVPRRITVSRCVSTLWAPPLRVPFSTPWSSLPRSAAETLVTAMCRQMPWSWASGSVRRRSLTRGPPESGPGGRSHGRRGGHLESVVLRRGRGVPGLETSRSEVGVSRARSCLSVTDQASPRTGRSMGETIRVKSVGAKSGSCSRATSSSASAPEGVFPRSREVPSGLHCLRLMV